MKLLANENIPYESIFYLRDKGYDVLSVGMDFSGTKDSDIMKIAIDEERIILTFDRDYGELIFRLHYKPTKGVVYMRLSEYNPGEPGMIIDELLQSNIDLNQALTVIDHGGVRQRRY